MKPILVLDWGIGGLPTLISLQAHAPKLPLCYLSDSGYTPYGRVPPQELKQRITQIYRYIKPSALLIACNAASSVLIDEQPFPIPTFNIISSGVAAIQATLDTFMVEGITAPRIGIIGGLGTIQSGHYQKQLLQKSPYPHALNLVCEQAQALSAHVEAGRLTGVELIRDLDELCTRLGSLDALTLACTHYPALLDHFQARFPHSILIDPVKHFVHHVLQSLMQTQHFTPNIIPAHSFTPLKVYTTGSPTALVRNALKVWGIQLTVPCHSLSLPHLS